MNATNRPPFYLTEREFARLVLTDDQWEEIRYRLAERENASAAAQAERALREKEQETNNVVRPILAAIGGLFLASLAYLAVEALTGDEMLRLLESPLFFVFWTGVTAWLMRKQ